MPLVEHEISTYSGLQDLLEKAQKEDQEFFIFFSCTLDTHGDPKSKLCYEAEDALMEYTEFVRNSKRSIHLVYFRILLEEYFSPGTEMSKDHRLRIVTVPMLLKWQGYQRLVGRQCCKTPLLSLLFEREDQHKFPVYQPCNFFQLKDSKVDMKSTLVEGDHPVDKASRELTSPENSGVQKTDLDQNKPATAEANPSNPSNTKTTSDHRSQESAGSKSIHDTSKSKAEGSNSKPDQETPEHDPKSDAESLLGKGGAQSSIEHKAQSP